MTSGNAPGFMRKRDISTRRRDIVRSYEEFYLQKGILTAGWSGHITMPFGQLCIKHQLNCIGHLFGG
jgi:hypothetical protein